VKYWEIISDNLSKAGWSLGWVSAIDLQGRTIWNVDAHDYGKRFIVRADELVNRVRGTAKGDTPVRGEFDLVTERAEAYMRMKSWQLFAAAAVDLVPKRQEADFC
jgi:hypothetical protein